MAVNDSYNDLVKLIIDLRIDVSVLQTDLSYLKATMQEVREQARRNAVIATEEAATTRDLLTSGRIIRWVLIAIGGVMGALFTIGRDTWREIIRPWFQ